MPKKNKVKGKPVDISIFCASEIENNSSIPRFPRQDVEHEREFTDKGGNWRRQEMTETGKHLSGRRDSIENITRRNLGTHLTEGTITSWGRNIHGKSVQNRIESTEGDSWRRQDMAKTERHLSDRSESPESISRINLGKNLTESTSTGWRSPIQDGKSTRRSQKITGICDADNLTEDTITSWRRNVQGKGVQNRRESTEGGSWRRQNKTAIGKHLSDRSDSPESINRINLGKNLTEGTSTGWRSPIQDRTSTWKSQNITGICDADNLTEDTITSWGRNFQGKGVQNRRESTECGSWRRRGMTATGKHLSDRSDSQDKTATGKHLSDRSDSPESINRINLGKTLTEGRSTGWRSPIQDGISIQRSEKITGLDDTDNLTKDTITSWGIKTSMAKVSKTEENRPRVVVGEDRA